MQLKIYIDLGNNKLSLPLNYNHILQGIIYNSLKNDANYQRLLHDSGLSYNNNFKFFTFSSLCGNHRIVDKQIVFENRIFFEIRSADGYFITLLYEYFKQNNIRFGNNQFCVNLNIQNKIIKDDYIEIKMNSPICVTQKKEDNKSIYLSPRDKLFEEAVNLNFKNKYYSFYNTEPYSNIKLTNIELSHKDKVVTTLKGIYITAWKGQYILEGSPDYLTFLYNCGLGSRNSQGFGMFDII